MVKEFQLELKETFRRIFLTEADKEWRAIMGREIYSPRVDVCVGPYAIEAGLRLIDIYNDLFDRHRALFYELCKIHVLNLNIGNYRESRDEEIIHQKIHDLRNSNLNSRCFIAIEIENKSSRKHLMGGAINCCALGRIGIAIGFNENMHLAFCNLYRYFTYLQSVDKLTFHTRNLLILTSSQLREILNNYLLELDSRA